MKTMKLIAQIAFAIFLCSSATARGQEELHGVFSNKAEGFDVVTIMVHDSGFAYFHAAVAGVIGKWSYDKSASTLTIEYFDLGAEKDANVKFVFDARQRAYSIVGDAAKSGTDPSKKLRHVTNTIPDQLIQAFRVYPGKLEEWKRKIQAEVQKKRENEEKLAREKPEYERLRKSIIMNPNSVLAQKFHDRNDTPATRALKSVLGDREIALPEDVLIALLEEVQPDNSTIRELVFSRPELTAETIERFYPKALDWGAQLSYQILANIANHPNTPRRLIEDLALRKELPVGGTHPAQSQMKKYARNLLAGDSQPPPETFLHLYEFALKAVDTDIENTILLELAKSSSTPPEILAKIAGINDRFVQGAIVSNTNTPLGTVKQLTQSRFSDVRAEAAGHPNVGIDILLALSKDNEGSVRAAVAAHPVTPVATLTGLQSDKDFDVRRNLIGNPNTPISVLEKLAADEYEIIKSKARDALRTREKQNETINGDNK